MKWRPAKIGVVRTKYKNIITKRHETENWQCMLCIVHSIYKELVWSSKSWDPVQSKSLVTMTNRWCSKLPAGVFCNKRHFLSKFIKIKQTVIWLWSQFWTNSKKKSAWRLAMANSEQKRTLRSAVLEWSGRFRSRSKKELGNWNSDLKKNIYRGSDSLWLQLLMQHLKKC